MALNFPDTPVHGDQYVAPSGIVYIYNSFTSSWDSSDYGFIGSTGHQGSVGFKGSFGGTGYQGSVGTTTAQFVTYSSYMYARELILL